MRLILLIGFVRAWFSDASLGLTCSIAACPGFSKEWPYNMVYLVVWALTNKVVYSYTNFSEGGKERPQSFSTICVFVQKQTFRCRRPPFFSRYSLPASPASPAQPSPAQFSTNRHPTYLKSCRNWPKTDPGTRKGTGTGRGWEGTGKRKGARKQFRMSYEWLRTQLPSFLVGWCLFLIAG